MYNPAIEPLMQKACEITYSEYLLIFKSYIGIYVFPKQKFTYVMQR